MIINNGLIISLIFLTTLTIMEQNNTTAPESAGKQGLSFLTRRFGTATVRTSTYQSNDAMSVELVDENGESIAVLSVNFPESAHLLGENEFFAKTWSENEEIAEDALASGIFRDTGRTSSYGFMSSLVNASIWTFAKAERRRDVLEDMLDIMNER